MPMDWDAASSLMDDKVDDLLGDTINMSTDGGATFTARKGFYLPFAASPGIEGIDEIMASKPMLKVRKSLFPGGRYPSYDYDRFQTAKLGAAVFRPSGAEPQDQGRYYIFDVQKA